MSGYRRIRRYPRHSVQMQVRISSIDPETDPGTGRPRFRSSTETIRMLSRGGAFIESSDPLPPGQRILVELELPDRGLEVVGRVAWSKITPGARSGAGIVGVEFIGGGDDAFRELDRFLERSSDSSATS